MERIFSRPKRFGEILDLTFQVIRKHFKELFSLLFLFTLPIIVIQALAQLSSGRGFITDVPLADSFIDQIFIAIDTLEFEQIISPGEIISSSFIILFEILIVPVSFASIILLVKKVKDNENIQVKEIIKQAFSRYGALVGSSFVYSLIAIVLITLSIFIITFISIFVIEANPFVGLGLFFILLIGLIFMLGLLLVRWSMYLAVSLFKRVAPGITESFRITSGRAWMTFWLFLTLFIITGFIENSFGFIAIFTGQSVLYTLILNLVSIFARMILAVGYAVIYFDLEVRHSANDIKGMIDDYHNPSEA
ncbi:hypothetical protein SAMN04488134_11044 [Amphibacillus marinus]|uniref:Membrane domain of glycerophosphoryl diester phosphodiesterase n=1 Tax=Amphibacillus marinus TaxID=872970 RepID=A0A1H8RCQ1_9BACI|nr:hypothetical protein [Amphibacillus marinus]SEO64235.1 hypothetical protein SAMN04488134_11044 [Amphibacillus marinus]